ncbi:MAG: M23 family metallopeptidase [Smithellaceae bacterium]|nr:M23 family metallopeptidase [Smithellaceae bacterium]
MKTEKMAEEKNIHLPISMLFIFCSIFLFNLSLAVSSVRIESEHFSLPATVRQGEPFFFHLASPQPLAGAEIEWLNRKIWTPAHRVGGQWLIFVLLGVGPEREAGTYPLSATIATARGEMRITRNLTVMSKTFPRQRLSLPAGMVTPGEAALARIRREETQIREVLRGATPLHYWWPGFIRPVMGEVSSAFGLRRVLNGESRSPHRGVDFRGASGTPVRSWSAGIVALAAEHYFGGRSLYIDHGLGIISSYLHLSEILVEPGQLVTPGQAIGRVGNTGRSTAPHLHFGLSVLGEWVDPLPLLDVPEP